MRTPYHHAVAVTALASLSIGAASSATLIDAVREGDDKSVAALIQQRADVNVTAPDGSTPLMWAVHRGDLAIVDRLLRAGAKVGAANTFGMVPLAMAAESGSAVLVDRLLKAEADANARLPGGETVLMTAARTGNAEAVRALLARGADVNAKEHTRDQTALMWAATHGRTAAVKVLIEAGANVTARSTELKSFHLNTYIAGRKDADTSARLPMFTALLFAARRGHLETARALLDAGADVNDAGPDGTPALHIAIINGNWELAAMLLERGADAKAESPGGTGLHHIARVRAGKFLMKNPTGLPMPESNGTLSAMALAKLLLARGADPNARISKLLASRAERGGQAGLTPLMMAQIPADPELMRVLIAGGADPKLTSTNGTTVLMMAAGLGLNALLGDDEEAFENVKLAIELGVDVNAKNEERDTALHGAAFRNYLPILQYLVERGSMLDPKNTIGWTPLMEARWTARGLLNTRPEAEAYLRGQYEARGLSPIVPTREEAIERLFDSKGGPLITCPEAGTAKAASGEGAIINYPLATAMNRVMGFGSVRQARSLPVTCTPPSGTVFPIGATTVVCTATDDYGRSDACAVLMKVLP